ncbi:hypothetical protein BE15_08580 [Sorangium cellulosum]|uniref:Uncharacterized protein n=1 Tax=Sorangium cellulosum TaxID=56 RepID=A0A150QPI7_SORCE|nr:hypothetical protein BE15_08580 [Sorangium cellulosum]
MVGRLAPTPQKPQLVEAPLASAAFQLKGATENWPLDGVVVTFHALSSLEPLSAMTMLQVEIGAEPTFFKDTFAQYPDPHCDWTERTASIDPSALTTPPSRDAISSSSVDAPMQATREHAIEAEQRPSKPIKRMKLSP